MSPNEAERERWNEERRASVWPKRERLTGEVTPHVLDAVAPRSGERILDVGSGGGRSTLAAAKAVGGSGTAVGLDISAGLVRLARERAAAAGAPNAEFVHGDAQTEAPGGPPFDAAMSQFGVMFFDDPVAAFANIGRQLRPGGRLAFACWEAREVNPWFFADAVARFVPLPPPASQESVAPGPFALADPARTTVILERAGFTRVHRTSYRIAAVAPEDSVLDELQLSAMGVPDEHLGPAMEAARSHLGRFRIDSSRTRFPLAFQIFRASRPSR